MNENCTINYCMNYNSKLFLFYIIKTVEVSKDTYHIGLGIPVLKRILENNEEVYVTYRTTLDKSSPFRYFHMEDGIEYEIIQNHPVDTMIECTEETYQETLELFLERTLEVDIEPLNNLRRLYIPDSLI